jgi:hypothetical protein
LHKRRIVGNIGVYEITGSGQERLLDRLRTAGELRVPQIATFATSDEIYAALFHKEIGRVVAYGMMNWEYDSQ